MERNLTYVALFAALIAVLGLVPALTLAAGVPVTAQSLGVMLAGTVLGARRGALAVLLFLAVVALGLPVLAGGRGGLGVFVGPTAGFLVGFPVAAFVTGWIVERWRAPLGLAAFVGALVGGVAVLYAFGICGLMLVVGMPAAKATLLMTPFLVGDAVKAALAGLVTRGLALARPGSVLSRTRGAGA